MAHVFVVDRAAFFGGDWPQGFVPLHGAAAHSLLADACARGRFAERALAESTPAWKQFIPYCVLRCAPAGQPFGNGAHDGVFVVRRTRGQSEARLHGALSIGIGGHVEPADGDPGAAAGEQFFRDALRRELAEELDLRHVALPAPHFLGLLNDDSTEVGAVHAGLVYAVDVPLAVAAAGDVLRIRERSKMRGGFTHLVEFQELWQNPAQFESWSQLLVGAGIAGPMGGFRTSGSGDHGG
jgi:predicted NUDIX family phosphoesterase